LLLRDRIQTRKNLSRKNILDSGVCVLCNTAAETSERLLFGCQVTKQFWEHVGGIGLHFQQVTELWNFPRPITMPITHFNSFILLCC